MELTAEITKVFGQEMAKLFADQISEEELKNTAQEAWKDLNYQDYRYGSYERSQIEKLIDEAIIRKVMGKVEEILNQPRSEEEIKKEAERIVNEAREKANQLLIDRMAEGIANSPFIDWNLKAPLNDIACAVMSRRE